MPSVAGTAAVPNSPDDERCGPDVPFRKTRAVFHLGAILLRALSPPSIRPPFARYSHGIAVPAGHRLVFTSGQLGIGPDESIPADCEAQADLCFANIAAILAEDRMTLANVVRLNAYVTGREHMVGYMRSRDRQFPGTPPSSTLVIVTGFTRPEFVVEIEAVAAAAE
jgi:2-iminobutanoate/2-iminopropanoate deaminase